MSEPQEFLPLTVPVFHILLALADEPRHGYAILQDIERRSDGSVKLGTGTLYTAIRRMLKSGLIERSHRRPTPSEDDVRRNYYRLTRLGSQVARAEAARMNGLVDLARSRKVF